MKKRNLSLTATVGNPAGRFARQENRVAKLIAGWEELRLKMMRMVERGGGVTETARMAYGVLLMMETGIRVGNEESAEGVVSVNQILAKKDNPENGIKTGDVIWTSPNFGKVVQTYGLTTLMRKHVKTGVHTLMLDFVGKKSVAQKLIVKDKFLIKHAPPARILPFTAKWLDIEYKDLYRFVKKYVGRGFKPKDIRAAVVNRKFVARFFVHYAEDFDTETRKSFRNRIVTECVTDTAEEIGHTPGVSRKAYLSAPLLTVLATYVPGSFTITM